jgi:hypothetical protein
MVYYYLSIYKQVTLVEDLIETEPERSSKLIEKMEDAFKNYKVIRFKAFFLIKKQLIKYKLLFF